MMKKSLTFHKPEKTHLIANNIGKTKSLQNSGDESDRMESVALDLVSGRSTWSMRWGQFSYWIQLTLPMPSDTEDYISPFPTSRATLQLSAK